MVELDRQLRPARAGLRRTLVVALLACGLWIGWWAALPLLASALFFRLADGPVERSRHPEYLLFAVWVMSELLTAGSVVLAGEQSMVLTAWLALPVLTLGARFSRAGTAAGVGVALAVLVGTELALDAGAVRANPSLLIGPAVLILCVAFFQSVVVHSELRLRGEVVIDPLTGLLNRRALERRIGELEQQSQLTLQPVGLIVADVDLFKRFNDEQGHQAGDAVLVEIAQRLRGALRAFDFCYRTGGEEFLVVLPGADLEASIRLAETLRREVAALESGGRGVTMSFGAAASSAGEPFVYQSVFACADTALYEAKRLGRNRVCPQLAPASPRAA